MFVLVLLGVAAVGQSAPSASQVPSHVLVGDPEYRGEGGFRVSGGFRVARAAQQDQDQSQSEETESSPSSQGFDAKAILELAGATPSPVDRSGPPSYGAGRRRRQVNGGPRVGVEEGSETVAEQSSETSTDKPYVLPKGKYGDLARFLQIANAKPTPVDKDNVGYGRRRKRALDIADELQDTEGSAEESSEKSTEKSYVLPKGKYGDLARFLQIANVKPTPVDKDNIGYGRRRKRASDTADELQATKGSAEESSEKSPEKPYVLPKGKYGDLARFLQIANAKPTPVDKDNVGYGRRRKRSEDDILTNEIPSGALLVKNVVIRKEDDVPVAAVKVKSHGTNGLRSYGGVTEPKDGVFRGRYGGYGRRRRTVDFIPFSEYERSRVGTLKVEQNDFLALDKRLIAEQKELLSNARRVKKRHFGEETNNQAASKAL